MEDKELTFKRLHLCTQKYLDYIKPGYIAKGYAVPKWIIFAETMIHEGFDVKICYSKSTVSKYVYIKRGKEPIIKIRFSNHKANKRREMEEDADYYVGRGNLGCITTETVIEKILGHRECARR